MTSLFKDRTVNLISINQSITIQSPKPQKKKPILKLKESLTTSNSLKNMRKSCSLTKYSENERDIRRHEILLETPKGLANMPYRNSRYLLSKGCQLSDVFKKENKPIMKNPISKEVKMYLPLMKSPYKLIEELKSAVDKAKHYKSNAAFIHEVKSEYYINKMNQEKNEIQARIKKTKKGSRSREEEDELNDKLILDNKEDQRLKKEIRVFLGAKDSKFNQAIEMKKNHFFDKMENRINFREDVYIVPLLMCKLSKYPVTRANQIEYFNIKNNISPGILRYLFSVRVCIQKEKDECEKTQKRKANLAFTKRNNTKEEINDDSNKEDANGNNYFNHSSSSASPFYQNEAKIDFLRLMKETSPLNGSNIYEIEDFFIHKYIRYEYIQIASDKEKDFVLNKSSNLSYRKYQTRHIPKIIASLN